MSNTELATVTEEVQESKHMKPSRLEDSLFSKDFAPHYMKLAGQLATSELVPKCFRGKPQDLFLCWSMGYQVGLTPEQSMQCIAVINGKPAMWGDDMLALCMSHKDFDDIIETPIIKNDSVIGYNCTVKRKGKADKENVFTLDMAKKAGLLAKGGVWTQYPERMLKLRARGFCLRDAFPDALKGIKPREEVEDYIDVEYKPSVSTGSRTELLKKDFMSKKGDGNAESINRLCAPSTNIPAHDEATQNQESDKMDKDGTEAINLHLEIKRLIEEKSFTEDRLEKALKYYEVASIDALDLQCCEHFINHLLKL
jgi:hypothetical protein